MRFLFGNNKTIMYLPLKLFIYYNIFVKFALLKNVLKIYIICQLYQNDWYD